MLMIKRSFLGLAKPRLEYNSVLDSVQELLYMKVLIECNDGDLLRRQSSVEHLANHPIEVSTISGV